MEIVKYCGWQRNVRLANKAVELIATLDVGPRIVRLAAGRKVEHVEDWWLFGGVPAIRTEPDVDKHVRPLLAKAR